MSLWTKNIGSTFSSQIIAPSMRIGDLVNNTTIESDGTIKFNGDATVWDDIPPIPLLVQRQGAANNPTLSTFISDTKQLTFAVNDYVYFNYEFLHDYKEGSSASWHVHWVTNGTEGVATKVKWEIEYTISNSNAVAPFSDVFPAVLSLPVETTIPANTPDKAHIISSFGLIALPTIKIGAYIIGRFKRIASTGTNPAANPFALTVGGHIEKDTCGSRQMYTK